MTGLLPYLAKGAVLGLSVAAPVGPIGILFIRRTIAGGFVAGFAGGVGTAAADAFYAAIAATGLTAVSAVLAAHGTALRLAGGVMLLWLGIGAIRAAGNAGGGEPLPAPAAAPTSWVPAFMQTFALTLANPATILSFAAVFGGLGIVEAEAGAGGGGAATPAALVAGVFAGSLAWWAALGGALSAARTRITPRALGWINRVSGIVLLGFAATMLLELLTP